MADVALAAAVNLPALTETLLARQEEAAAGADGQQSSAAAAAQQAKPALLSAAALVASAASALAGAAAAQQDGEAAPAAESAAVASQAAAVAQAAASSAAVPSARDVQQLLEDEINAMNCLLDGRWALFCCLGARRFMGHAGVPASWGSASRRSTSCPARCIAMTLAALSASTWSPSILVRFAQCCCKGGCPGRRGQGVHGLG